MSRIESLQLPGTALDISAKAACRYLGLRGAEPDENLLALVEKGLEDFRAAARFSACYLVLPCREVSGGVDFGAFAAPGESLKRNLRGCDKAILFAATTGVETERQRRRAELSSMAQAVVLDAIGSAAVEWFCDRLCEGWRQINPDFALRPRFSPGYGDLPLETQKNLLTVLDAGRKAGVSLTESLLMLPQKSVSAIVGLGKTGCTARHGDCGACENEDCEFRLGQGHF